MPGQISGRLGEKSSSASRTRAGSTEVSRSISTLGTRSPSVPLDANPADRILSSVEATLQGDRAVWSRSRQGGQEGVGDGPVTDACQAATKARGLDEASPPRAESAREAQLIPLGLLLALAHDRR